MNVPIFIKYERDNYEVAEIVTDELSQSIIVQELKEVIDQTEAYDWYIKNTKSDDKVLLDEKDCDSVANFIKDNLYDLEIIGEFKDGEDFDSLVDKSDLKRRFSDSFEIIKDIEMSERSGPSKNKKANSVLTGVDSFIVVDKSPCKVSETSQIGKINKKYVSQKFNYLQDVAKTESVSEVADQQDEELDMIDAKLFSEKKKTMPMSFQDGPLDLDNTTLQNANKSLDNSPKATKKPIELGSDQEKLDLFIKLKEYQKDNLKQITQKRMNLVKKFEEERVKDVSQGLQTSLKNVDKILENIPSFTKNNIGKNYYKDLASMESKALVLKNSIRTLLRNKILLIKKKQAKDSNLKKYSFENAEISEEFSDFMTKSHKEKFKFFMQILLEEESNLQKSNKELEQLEQQYAKQKSLVKSLEKDANKINQSLINLQKKITKYTKKTKLQHSDTC